MLTLRCTRKMMTRIGGDPTQSAISLTTTLGAWYANYFTHNDGDIAMFLNEQTRYAIPVPLQDDDTIETICMRLLDGIDGAIKRNGLSPATASRVVDEYQGGFAITPTADRSMLGTMNDSIQMCRCWLDGLVDGGGAIDWLDIDRVLNKAPQKPLGWDFASERLVAALRPTR